MRFSTKLSVFITLLTGLAVFITLIVSSLSFFQLLSENTEKHIVAVATMVDNHLISSPPEKLNPWLREVMTQFDITRILLSSETGNIFEQSLPKDMPSLLRAQHEHTLTLDLLAQPGMRVQITYLDPIPYYYNAIFFTLPMLIGGGLIILLLVVSISRLQSSLSGQARLENRAVNILQGARGDDARGSAGEWPAKVGSAMDTLLSELSVVSEQRYRLDALIRAFAAQDAKTGLNNRLFFENQLATLLEEHDQAGSHGVVMIIRLSDVETLRDSWGSGPLEGYLYTLINLLSSFVMRYPGGLLARYFSSDFAVLLPHRTIKEADIFASQLLNAVDALPSNRMININNILHIGISAWRHGQSKEQVMEHVEIATRNAVLQGANNWSVYDDNLPEKGRGSVKWRTLLELVLKQGGPRFYQKPSVNQKGIVDHREIMCRIFDGEQEILSAEYMPMVDQFGLSEQYDRVVVSRLLPLLHFWPEETLAVQISVDSLCRLTFQRWIRNTLMQCQKSIRSRIIFELAEADVCQHIGRLRNIVRLITALGVRVAVTQAGLTVVSTTYIKLLDVTLIKLHPGLVRNIAKRTENQLIVKSLVESCNGSRTRVFASGVRTRSEWQTLMDNGVAGAQGDFIAPLQLLDSDMKKYSQRYSV